MPRTRTNLEHAAERALAAFENPAAWRALQERGMRQDWSWGRAAGKYRELYAAAIADREQRAQPSASLGVSGDAATVFAGIDLGGTKILVLIADADGQRARHGARRHAGSAGPGSRHRAHRRRRARRRGRRAASTLDEHPRRRRLRAGADRCRRGRHHRPAEPARLAQRPAGAHPARASRHPDAARERRQLPGRRRAPVRRGPRLHAHDLRHRQHRHRRRHHHR